MASLRAGNVTDAVAQIDEAAATAHKIGNDWEEGLALSIKAAGMARLGSLREAQATYEAALDVLRDNNGWGVAHVEYGLGSVARARGDHLAAISHFQAALALYQEIDARPEIARCLAGIASVALAQGDLGLCRSSLTESLSLSLATGQRLPVARGLEAFAALEARAGHAVRAAKLAGAALELRSAAGHPPSRGAGARLEDVLEPARTSLGDLRANALLAEGRSMTADEAVSYAMRAPGASPEETGSGLPGDMVPGPRAVTGRPRRTAPPAAARRPGRAAEHADPAGAGDRRADRPRAEQPGHRPGTGHQPGDRGPARGQHPGQARVQLPGAGRGVDGPATRVRIVSQENFGLHTHPQCLRPRNTHGTA